jgi:hypothetical protein
MPAKREIPRRFALRNDGDLDFFRNLFSRAESCKIDVALQAAEKSENAVIPSEARHPPWFKWPQKEGFLVASLLGMTAILIFSATSLAAEGSPGRFAHAIADSF